MADYSRPGSGERFKFSGMKLNAPPDGVGLTKYPIAVNIRETLDNAVQTRPGLIQLFTTISAPITDIRAYTQLETDDLPRLLARSATGNIYLDTGVALGAPSGIAPDGKLGVSMIPFRPSQSPVPYMYIANGIGYSKYSAPDASNNVVQSNVGIAEPQVPPTPVIQSQQVSYVGPPSGGVGAVGGDASALAAGQRLTDTIQGIFHDPVTGTEPTTIQVTAGSSLAAGVYLYGAVQAYFYNVVGARQGAFRLTYPVNTGSANAAAVGNSLLFNPPQFNGTTDPDVQPMQWAIINSSGGITGYTQPFPGDTGQSYYMTLLTQLYIPVAGSYTININHDDGIIFAIAGAALVSGPVNDPFAHTETAVGGYTFTNGTIAGTNGQGYHPDTFVVSFPVAGVYSMEIDFAQNRDNQCLNVYNNSAIIVQAGANQQYQRDMVIALDIAGTPSFWPVLDVYPPLPQAIGIAGIYYFSGNTGECVIVPKSLGPATGTEGTSLFSATYLSGLKRGALVQIGNEVCYVEGTSIGPDGTVAFQTTTVGAHTTTDQLFGVPAISVLGDVTDPVGTTITSPDVTFDVTLSMGAVNAIGTLTTPIVVNPFLSANVSFQDEDYIHISLNVDNLGSINEMKLLFDISDGTFEENFYYYTIRPSDIQAGVQNLLTQLGVAQLVTQQATIDEEKADTANNQGVTTSSAQTSPGNSQWSEIKFQISELTRVGNDQTRSLQNAVAMQILVNANATVSIATNSLTVIGGFSPDVGDSGAPYQYRARPRSQVTGAKGNPSPVARWSVSPRRQSVLVPLPDASYDPQIDTWDVFRYGGTVTSWRLIASVPAVSNNSFVDNFGDDTADAGIPLDFDNYQPWPTVGIPFGTTALTATVSYVGTEIVVTSPSAVPNLLRYLPGNEIQVLDGIAGHVYTLWTRPTQIGVNQYLLQIVENAGVGTAPILIAEPDMAQQMLPYMWGPDAAGTVFAVGDVLRAGSIYLSKPNDPDSALDATIELTPPSELLLGGEVKDGLSYVASTERWWALYPQFGAAQRYNAVQQPIPRGIIAPFGHCTDGKDIYFWAKDGIWSTGKGSLTDADLYNLFPHEGSQGANVTYNGVTAYAPDYSRAGTFRLAKVNDYLYALYQDSIGDYHCLTMYVPTQAWRIDVYASAISAIYHPEQQAGSLFSATTTPPTPALYPALVTGDVTGAVCQQADGVGDNGDPIQCAIATVEWDGGDFRAGKQWGDIFLDILSQNATIAQPMSGGVGVDAATTVTANASRQTPLVSLDGGLLDRFLGLMLTWGDYSLSTQMQPTVVYGWQPSFIPKQEASADRDSDWVEVVPGQGAGWVQGFLLHADTFGAPKSFLVQDSDTLALHAFTPMVNQSGESTKAYSFVTPFVAHLVRIVPQDKVLWRLFDWKVVAEPTPEMAETWQTQGTSFTFNGYSHIQRIVAAYQATAPVTITITVEDGTSPQPFVLPANGGVLTKLLQVLTFNKGQIYFFKAQSNAPFQLWLPDFEILLGNWGRSGSYVNYKSLGGNRGDKASI
jgi:hypothetical protein